jgi:hypothetical protein
MRGRKIGISKQRIQSLAQAALEKLKASRSDPAVKGRNPNAPRFLVPTGEHPYRALLQHPETDQNPEIASCDDVISALEQAKRQARYGSRTTVVMRALDEETLETGWVPLAYCSPPGTVCSSSREDRPPMVMPRYRPRKKRTPPSSEPADFAAAACG